MRTHDFDMATVMDPLGDGRFAAGPSGPLRCRFSTRFLQNGFFEEDGENCDSTCRLVAHSRQLALAP